MINFGELKNNIEILRKYITKMNLITQCQIKPTWIQQKFLRENNPHIFLQLLHYILIKFSPFTLFVKVLDFYPTIKDDSDKKFINNVMILSRKMFQIDVKIDLQQFLSQKFLQKKTQFVSIFCKAAYEFHVKQNKPSNYILSNLDTTGIKTKKLTKISENLPSKLQNKYYDEDDQDQIPRNLNIIPLNRDKQILNIKKQQSSSSDEDMKQLIKNKNKLKQKTTIKNLKNNISEQKNVHKQKDFNIQNANVFPKNNFVQHIQIFEQNQEEEDNFRINNPNKQKILQKNIKNYQQITIKQAQVFQNISESLNNNQNQIDLSNYVTREQFMDIITAMNKNFTELLGKFNDFQHQVGGWVQNVNAKISILQENVKTIKNNL